MAGLGGKGGWMVGVDGLVGVVEVVGWFGWLGCTMYKISQFDENMGGKKFGVTTTCLSPGYFI